MKHVGSKLKNRDNSDDQALIFDVQLFWRLAFGWSLTEPVDC
jgi:hypothetical protein